jgi:hypothetical protein
MVRRIAAQFANLVIRFKDYKLQNFAATTFPIAVPHRQLKPTGSRH